MRIERVKFCNLASLAGEWDVRFDVPSYYENGIFLISGRTGSGKSTLLDAICLALYHKTPRINGGKEIAKILTHKQKYAFAQVVFTVQGQTYRSRYSYYKGGKSGKAKDDFDEVHLENLTTRQLLIDNPKNAKNAHQQAILHIIGLNFNQFRQSILLAQGEFASFLLAKSEERANILEALADSTIYSHISRKVFDLCKARVQEIDSLQQSLDAQRDEYALKENPTIKIQELNLHLEQVNAEYNSIKKELQVCARELEMLELWSKTTKQIDEKSFQEQQVSAQFFAFTKQLEEKKAAYDHLMHRQQAEYKRLALQKERLTKYQLLSSQLDLKQQDIAAKEQALLKLNDLIHNKSASSAVLKQSYEEQYLALHNCYSQEQLAAFVDEYVGRLRQLDESYYRFEQAQQHWQEPQQEAWQRLQQIQMQLAQMQYSERELLIVEGKLKTKRLASVALSIEKNIQKQLEIDQQLATLAHIYQELDTDRLIFNTTLKLFEERDKLIVDQPCLLCQQVVAVLPAVDNQSRAKVVQRLNAIEQRIEEHNLLYHELQAENNTLLRDTHHLKLEQADLSALIDQSLVDLGLENFATEEPLEALEQRYAQLKERQQLIEQLMQYDNIKQQHEELIRLKQEFLAAATQLAKLAGLGQQDDVCDEQGYLHLKELAQQLNQKIKKLSDKKLHIDQILQELNELRLQYDNIKQQLTDHKDEYERYNQQLIALTQEVGYEQSSLEEIDKQLNQLVDEAKQLADSVEASQRMVHAVDKELTLIGSELASLKEQQQQCLSVLRLDESQLKEQYLELFTKKRQSVDEFTQMLGALELNLSDLHQQLGNHQGKLEQYEAIFTNIARLDQQLQVAKDKHMPYLYLNDLIGSSDGKAFKIFAQALTFDRVVIAANDYLKLIQDRYLIQRQTEGKDLLAFEVVDQFQLDSLRAVQTLSGGERFMISLALALGLASLASQRVQVDSLFLDEGFGTLDSHSLEVILDALTSLRERGKVVGLISHVELLKERISSKIEVIPQGSGVSKLVGEGISFAKTLAQPKANELF